MNLVQSLVKKYKTACRLMFFPVLIILFNVSAPAASAAGTVHISADQLEYLSEKSRYKATGSVEIIFDDMFLEADKVEINDQTSDAVAFGNVIYQDSESIIQAEKMEINLDSKLGTIYDGYIIYEKDNYHIRSDRIEKTKDKTFLLNKASITTCDADCPSWKISGSNITIKRHQSLSAWNTKFYIKKLPVLYTPYYWMPLIRKRQTGLLPPSIGYSTERGQYYKQGFFWAFKENQDISFYLDYYSELKFAQGIDYRYILSPDMNGEFWLYHARDRDTSRKLFEFKSYHNLQLTKDISGFLTLHTVNEFDYYDVMGSTSEDRIGFESGIKNPFSAESEENIQKYLESNLQIAKPFSGGRMYVLGQYRQSLEGDSGRIPQSLPETGIALNTQSKDYFAFNMFAKGNNFVKDRGQKGQRFDINSNVYFSYGRMFNITQRIGLRDTAYYLDDPDMSENRFFLDSNTALITRIFKRYPSFVHIIEPSVEYAYIPEIEQEDIPIFDSTDSFVHTSNITYSLTNEIIGFPPFILNSKFRISQSYDLLADEEPLSPILTEGSLSSTHINLNMNISYDVYDSWITDLIASIRLKNMVGYIGTGKNFRRSSLNQTIYMTGLNSPIRLADTSIPVGLHGKAWYDNDENDIQRINISSTYRHQCWGLSINYLKMPDEYNITFMIELVGLGAFSSQTLEQTLEKHNLYQR